MYSIRVSVNKNSSSKTFPLLSQVDIRVLGKCAERDTMRALGHLNVRCVRIFVRVIVGPEPFP